MQNTQSKQISGCDSTSDEDQADIVKFSDDSDTVPRLPRRDRSDNTKLPPFTGKESWLVWYNRFQDVSERRRWNDARKLDEILPKLQGVAGEFVFAQLSKSTRSSYKSLMKELDNRFRVIENPRAFRVQFSHRDQKPTETVEEYAAELKRLYDKAHPDRDHGVRREDLLRRFLDGLCNEGARFQVEYFKEPSNIDEATFEVVNYLETKASQSADKRNRQPTRLVQPADDSDDEADDEADLKNREASRPDRKSAKSMKIRQSGVSVSHVHGTRQSDQFPSGKLHIRAQGSQPNRGHAYQAQAGHQPSQIETRVCYNCNVRGHLSRDCQQPRVSTKPPFQGNRARWSPEVYSPPRPNFQGNAMSQPGNWTQQRPTRPTAPPCSDRPFPAYNPTGMTADAPAFQPLTAAIPTTTMPPQSSGNAQQASVLLN